MTEFKDKVVVVTGASRGIGRAIALEMGQAGATVVVNYNRSATAAEDIVRLIGEAGGDGMSFQADVSDSEQVDAMFDAVNRQYGRVDVLVNNAGITNDNIIMRLKPEDFDTTLDTNLRSAWLCCRAASRPMMKQRGGRIINITSVVGISGNGGQTSYAASKAGLIGLTKSLAKELAPRGITVNAVAPGFIETDMTSELSEALKETAIEHIPLKRMGTAEDVAHAVAFLSGERAGYITGQVVVVDGGMVM